MPVAGFGVGVQVYTAEVEIEPGEEITVNYTGLARNRGGRLWFEDGWNRR